MSDFPKKGRGTAGTNPGPISLKENKLQTLESGTKVKIKVSPYFRLDYLICIINNSALLLQNA